MVYKDYAIFINYQHLLHQISAPQAKILRFLHSEMMQNQLQGQGVNQMMGIGQMQQQLGQASLDADRANQMQLINRPMQMYGFMSDILSGAPATMGYQYTQNYGQAGSPFSQMLGTGASILGGLGQFGKMMK